MTVCVGVAVNDCLVFAADSAATLVQTDETTGNSQIINVYQHGDKIFNLYRGLPVCAMTCGMGNIGSASIATLAKDLRRRLTGTDNGWAVDKSKYSLEEIASKARRYLFDERFKSLNPLPAAPHSLEFWVGGYSSDFDSGHEVWKISIVNGACSDPEPALPTGTTGLFVGGQPAPINRLVGGFDQGLLQALNEAGVDRNSAQQLVNYLRKKLEAQMVMPTMPIKDAIELADFLVNMTKQYFRFLPGADIVGGDTDIAVVTKYEGFKWIRRKHFYPPSLNPLEIDHA